MNVKTQVKTNISELVAQIILEMEKYGVKEHNNIMLKMDSLYVVNNMGEIISGDLNKCLGITALEDFEKMVEVMEGKFFTSLDTRLEVIGYDVINARELD